MRGSAGLVLVALAGCDSLFGLQREYAVDAVDDLDAPPVGECWSATALGNEDGDEFVDGCDPCPADPDARVIDTDRDTVGDVCDPDPEVADSKIVAFDGFSDTAAWTVVAGSWAPSGGNYEKTGTVGLARTELAPPATNLPVVDVRFSTFPCGDGCGPGAYVVLGIRQVGCIYEYKSGTDVVSIVVDGATVQTMTPSPEASPDRIVVRVLVNNRTECRAYSGGRMTAELVTTTSPWAMTTTRVGLVARAATASFRSITVLGTP